MYKVKHKADGTVERCKARLVAKGFTQQLGVDYIETFSPVARITTIRTLLAVSVHKGWFIHQLDVNNAFLHGDLNEEVYMVLPPGFQSSKMNQVCKLSRSLYGLKQASRQWNAKLTAALNNIGFSQAKSDPSLFTKQGPHYFAALLVYDDDIVIASDSMEVINNLKKFLDASFKIKDLGELSYFLGIEAVRREEGLYLNQRKYVLDILKDSGFLLCKPASTPITPSSKLAKDDSPLLEDAAPYRRLVGRLLYLTATRPDISYAVQQLSQFVGCPTEFHLVAAHRC